MSQERMALFDELPKKLREAIANSDHGCHIDVRFIRNRLLFDGDSEGKMIKFVERFDLYINSMNLERRKKMEK
jgi:hypothetical protein